MWKLAGFLGVLIPAATAVLAQTIHDMELPPPVTEGGMPLMQALRARRTSREFSEREIPLDLLSNLLWAADGINRPDGRRTAPSARNWQEIEIYVVMRAGTWLYDPARHALKAVVAGDLREKTGHQEFLPIAPLDLVYVADTSKMAEAGPEEQARYMATDAAFVSENVYLFCASEGLATVVRGSVDRPALATALKLPATKLVALAQTVGYPAGGSRD